MLASCDREKLRKILKLAKNYEIDSVVALGYPQQESEVEEWRGDLKYFKDAAGKMHVPKRELKSLIVDIK